MKFVLGYHQPERWTGKPRRVRQIKAYCGSERYYLTLYCKGSSGLWEIAEYDSKDYPDELVKFWIDTGLVQVVSR
jgi:hypothetical protein